MRIEKKKGYIADYKAIRTLYTDGILDDEEEAVAKCNLLQKIIVEMQEEVNEEEGQNGEGR